MKGNEMTVMPRHQAGITLIELMIVIVIVAILASLAVPSYRDYVLRTNRMEAVNGLLEVAACQERVYIKQNQYDTASCDVTRTTPNGHYGLGMAYDNTLGTQQGYTLTASANGGQTSDSCGNLTLTSTGTRGASAASTAAEIERCWKGKKI